MADAAEVIDLPRFRTEGSVSLEQALKTRRSVRSFPDQPLDLGEVAQLLWSAQGVSDPRGYRTAPSAGATYPLEILVAAGEVAGLPPGVYRYRPSGHDLLRLAAGDRRAALFRAALSQGAVGRAPAVFVITAVYERTKQRYGERGIRYVHMEAGHAAQNLSLQAAASGLCGVVIGAFHDHRVQSALSLPPGEHPLYLIPMGRSANK